MNRLQSFAELYRQELLAQVIPFWETHSLDREQGGYFTCLQADGRVFDRDKFIWLQARQVWTFAMLYQQVAANPAWMDIALHGADFLEKYGRDEKGDWYFSLNQQGAPLVAAYNIFSDCFAAMAFGKLYQITQEPRYAEIAITTFDRILARQHHPKGHFTKQIGSTRPLKNFALPMILCNLSLELESLLPPEQVESTIQLCLEEVMTTFYDNETGWVLENVSPDGSLSDSFEGRLLNPGHAIEAMWFVMDLAKRKGDEQLGEEAAKRAIQMLELGWDPEYGGIFYFLDRKGYPPQQLEWDQKLWWVHLESLICLAKAYRQTGSELYADWFEKVHTYSWAHFRDLEHGGEWYGYLNREGRVLLPLKGGKWKGCFHVPRALFQLSQVLA
ncbi:MAG: AGE family epimerase/isomerase [Bacteroidota bacterium]